MSERRGRHHQQRTPDRFAVRRAYEEPEADDGYRVLVDRLWPRGVSKERAHLDEWLKSVAPSKELRMDLHQGKAGYEDFADRYDGELSDDEHTRALDHLRELAEEQPVTLVTAVKDMDHSHIPVLLTRLGARPTSDSGSE